MGSPMGPGGGGSRRTLQSISFPKILIFQNRISAIGPKSGGTDSEQLLGRGGVEGEISNYNGVGSQIYMSPHAPSYKLSKKLSFSKIGPVQVVQNHGELIRNSFCRLTQKVPPNFRPLTLVRFWKMRAFWKAYTLGSAALKKFGTPPH